MVFFPTQQDAGKIIVNFAAVFIGQPNHHFGEEVRAQLCMEMLADTGRLGSLDLVELNPALDLRNQTAELVVDLLESLFGKSTLVRADR
jgi:hypothetical protein